MQIIYKNWSFGRVNEYILRIDTFYPPVEGPVGKFIFSTEVIVYMYTAVYILTQHLSALT